MPGTHFPAFAAEIERLGTPAYAYCWLNNLDADVDTDRVLVRIASPPLFTLLQGLDGGDRLTAFVEQAPGVWVAAGWRHPLVGQIRPPAGKVLFVRPPRAWEWHDDGPFTSVEPFSAVLGQTADTPRPGSVKSSPVAVALRLAPDAADGTAELWLVRDEPLAWLRRFVHSTDEHILARFTIAVTRADGRPCLVLRIRAGKEPPPVLVGMPDGYRPLLKLANLLIPVGSRLTPALRRETLRHLLAPDPKRLVWLRPLGDGSFRAESIPLAAFRPLTDWIEHRVEAEPVGRQAWAQTPAFGFERFRVGPEGPTKTAAQKEPKSAPARPTPAAPPEEKPARARRRGLLSRFFDLLGGSKEETKDVPTIDEAPPLPVEDVSQTAQRLPRDHAMTPPARADGAVAKAKALESKFLAAMAKLTPADRLRLWPELAAAYARANNPAEAAVCWLNALWEQEKISPAWAWGWLRAEAAAAGRSLNQVRLADWLGSPDRAAPARVVAAYAVWAARQQPMPPEFLANLSAVQAFLDAHEAELPLRAAWLARVSLARLTRGDVLGLARARDRLFDRLLAHGLRLDLDVPNFIRFAEAGDPERFKTVPKWLTDRRGPIRKWIERLGPESAAGESARVSLAPFGLEPEIPGTCAYADLMLAWGHARLGDTAEAERLRDQSRRALDTADPVHATLTAAFDYRIRQAAQGELVGGPLPADLLARAEGLSNHHRYCVDQLRQNSRILDPTERISAFWSSTYRHYPGRDELRRKLIDLPGLTSSALNERVEALLAGPAREDSAALPAVLSEVLEVAPRLDKALGVKVLDLVHVALDMVSGTPSLQLPLLEKGLWAAAYFDRPTTVQRLAHRFALFVEEQRGLPSGMLEELTGQTFRCLRRLGLKNEADRVLFQIAGWLTRGEDVSRLRKLRAAEWPSLMRTLLHVAAGWYYCGRDKEGHAIIDEVRRDLYDGPMRPQDRTKLALTYTTALSQVKPASLALGRFEELFQRLRRIWVEGTTNSHFTLQPLRLIDAVVRSVVSEDFTLGPAVRGWMDDDEYLVRQRIHRELKELMEEQGV